MCWLMTLEKPEETGTVKVSTVSAPTHALPTFLEGLVSLPQPSPTCAVSALPDLIQAVQSVHQWSQVSVPDPPSTSSLYSQAQCNWWWCCSSPARTHICMLSVTIKLESPSSNQQDRNQHRLCEGLIYQISVLDLKSMKFRSLQEQRQTSIQWRLDKISADAQPMKEVHKPRLCCPNSNVKGR